MTTTKKKTRRASLKKRKTGVESGIKSMDHMMENTTKMVGNVMIAGMGIGLAGAVVGMI